eukprot:snap_masked-scaffold_13-processed-gene-3.22-mRNA-1 protein AED:1.00 eAED:1.00 QI:0/-1/0/0/-1/1/1/0/259
MFHALLKRSSEESYGIGSIDPPCLSLVPEEIAQYARIQPLRIIASEALLEMGKVNNGDFLSSISKEAIVRDHKAEYKIRALNLIPKFMERYPSILQKKLTDVAETILATLDPGDKSLRKNLLWVSTFVLHELVKTYSQVSFHQRSQRLVVAKKALIVYDLRTASKWRILEGHQHVVVAVCFSPGGDKVASYSSAERELRLWQVGGSGLLSNFIGVKGKCIQVIKLPPVKNTDKKNPVKLSWEEKGVPFSGRFSALYLSR